MRQGEAFPPHYMSWPISRSCQNPAMPCKAVQLPPERLHAFRMRGAEAATLAALGTRVGLGGPR
jgi:hypothetical protein